jgi:hypothetical protein
MRRSVLSLVVVLCFVGCAKKDPVVENLNGAEPQRLTSGNPEAVKASFLEKAKACWFGNSKTSLSGYKAEVGSYELGSQTASQTIRIYPDNGAAQAFEVQFHPYNSNTLISTRNLGMPLEIAAKLKRDIENWMLGAAGCEN